MDGIHPKVTASAIGSGVGGALTVLVVWLLGFANIEVPPQVASALTVIFGTAVGFAAGYQTSSGTAP